MEMTREQWKTHVQAQQNSNLTMEDYCSEHDLDLPFYESPGGGRRQPVQPLAGFREAKIFTQTRKRYLCGDRFQGVWKGYPQKHCLHRGAAVIHVSNLSSLTEDRIHLLSALLTGYVSEQISAIVISGVLDDSLKTKTVDTATKIPEEINEAYLEAARMLLALQEEFGVAKSNVLVLPSEVDNQLIPAFHSFFFLPTKGTYYDSNKAVLTLPNLQIIGANVIHENMIGFTQQQVELWQARCGELNTEACQEIQRCLVTNVPIGRWSFWHKETIMSWRENNRLFELTVQDQEEPRKIVPQIVTNPGCIHILRFDPSAPGRCTLFHFEFSTMPEDKTTKESTILKVSSIDFQNGKVPS